MTEEPGPEQTHQPSELAGILKFISSRARARPQPSRLADNKHVLYTDEAKKRCAGGVRAGAIS